MNEQSTAIGGISLFEASRLRVLRRGGLLDDGDGQFDRLAGLVCETLGVPVALISLCHGNRQVFVAHHGLPARWAQAGEAPVAQSLCRHVLARGAPFVAGDIAADPVMRNDPAVAGSDIAAYIGVPLKADGELVGVLAATDRRVRLWDDGNVRLLDSLAAIIGSEIETRLSETRWRTLFEDMQESFYVAEAIRDETGRMVDFRYLAVNPAFERMEGRADAVGRTVSEVIPASAGELAALYGEVFATRRPKNVEIRVQDRWHEARVRPLDAERFAVTFADVTERRQAEMRIREIERRRRLAIETGDVGIFDLDLVTDELIWDDRVRTAFGLAPGRPTSREATLAAIHPDDRREFDARFARALGETHDFDMQFRTIGIDDGLTRWVSAKGQVIAEKERPIRFIGALRDVSDRVAADERRALLSFELAHRLKNTLAVVSSIVTQTLRSATGIPAARQALTSRIQALSKAHDLLLSGHHDAAPVGAIVAAALAVHDEERRVALKGPEILIDSKASLTLSLIAHELATNAGKYGALSIPGGHVAVEWRIDASGAGGRPLLVIEWREHGGPPVAAPVRGSFGTRLIEMGLSTSPGSEARITYAPEGLSCRIAAPMAEIATMDEDDPD